MEEKKLEEVVKRYKFPVIRYISTRDVMNNMINIINNTVCYMRKLLKE